MMANKQKQINEDNDMYRRYADIHSDVYKDTNADTYTDTTDTYTIDTDTDINTYTNDVDVDVGIFFQASAVMLFLVCIGIVVYPSLIGKKKLK